MAMRKMSKLEFNGNWKMHVFYLLKHLFYAIFRIFMHVLSFIFNSVFIFIKFLLWNV